MHFTAGVILKKENIEKRKKDFKVTAEFKVLKKLNITGEDIVLTEKEKEFECVTQEIQSALSPFIESCYYEDEEDEDSEWPETYLDWYVIGGRWAGSLPVKQPILDERKSEFKNYESDVYMDDFMSYAAIKDINFNTPIEGEKLIKCKKEYEDLFKKATEMNNIFFLKEYPDFETYKKDEEKFNTYSFLTSDGEWHELVSYSITDPKERNEKAKELFYSLLEKEDEEDIFVLVDCHI